MKELVISCLEVLGEVILSWVEVKKKLVKVSCSEFFEVAFLLCRSSEGASYKLEVQKELLICWVEVKKEL